MINFGVGSIICTPTNLADGSAIANPTPTKLAVLQESSLDLSVDIKTLYGAGMYPVAVAQGKGKIELKSKTADISGAVLGSMFLGQSSVGGIKDVVELATAVPSSSPYTLTIVPANSGVFVADNGVYDASTATPLTRVASAPTTGQYAVSSSGVYTFSSADSGLGLVINYEYSATSTTAQTFNINNRNMGYTPSFSLIFRTAYDGGILTGKFFRGVSGKFSLPMKSEDFTTSDFEAQFFANAAGQVGWLCFQKS